MRGVVSLIGILLIACGGQAAEPPSRPAAVDAQEFDAKELGAFQKRIAGVVDKHLDALLEADGAVRELKGKAADGLTALAFYLRYEDGGYQRYRRAALSLAEQIVADMRSTKHGVLYIKEKEKGDGESIAGGGPPALGWYATAAAYIFHREGGREADLRYLAEVIDRYPWNEQGWWASTIDIESGKPKEPLEKPSIINKNAAIVLAAAVLGEYTAKFDTTLSKSLTEKARRCVFAQIIPAQEADGFWHYNLTGKDPGNKDILGYFMVTTQALSQLPLFTSAYRDEAFQRSFASAIHFLREQIAPQTDPNTGPPARADRRTPETPQHFKRSADSKRGLSVAELLIAGGDYTAGARIADYWFEAFPQGDRGQDGAHAAACCALVLRHLQKAQIDGATKDDAAANEAEANGDDVRVHRDVIYAEVDGHKLPLNLFLPRRQDPAAKRPPLVVYIHGGSWRAGSYKQVPVEWLVEAGFAVASIEYRFSQVAIFPAQIHDCKGAIRWLRAQADEYGYDATKIGVAGTSAGGHLGVLLGTSSGVDDLEGSVGGNADRSSRVQAVVDYYGPTDFVLRGKTHPERANEPGSSTYQLLGGPAVADDKRAARASGVTYVSADDAPLLILHGDKDKTCYIDQSESIRDAYTKAKLPVELVVLPGAGHGGKEFFTGDNQRRVTEFFRKHLAGDSN